MSKELVERAKEHFGKIVEEQLKRVEIMKRGEQETDFSKLKPIIIGVCFGDGIGEDAEKVAAPAQLDYS